MPDHDPKKTLTEISHLFLSSIREKQTNGAPRPTRTPPAPEQGLPAREPGGPWSGMHIDLTADEMAQVSSRPDAAHAQPVTRSVSAVIAAHLNGRQLDRVKDYARNLAGQVGGRIGLIEVDATEFRLMCFEPGMADDPVATDEQSAECYDPRQIAEAIEEMNWDVERWLLLLPTPRVPEAKALLRLVDHWVLLTTCDHDGVVSGYRSLKGLVEPSHQSKLTLALLDGTSETEMVAVYRKLAAVCQQFLGLRLDPEPPVRKSYRIGEHLVMFCRPTRDKAQMATQPQWSIVSQFLQQAKGVRGNREETAGGVTGDFGAEPVVVPSTAHAMIDDVVVVTAPQPSAPAETITVAPSPVVPVEPAPPQAAVAAGAPVVPAASASPQAAAPAFDEVIELTGDSATADAVLSAVLRQNNGSYVECPVRAPMCGGARVAVARDRGVVLFAIAREGLGELRNIGQAYRWLADNRPLLSMALPQFAIDTSQPPRLRLLVDHSDLSADALQPVLQSGHVTVQSYRKLHWGGKTGLLLDAA
ncbi:MAG: hypothetical protein AUI33_17330 [Ignavibacteria bacterium 13_1_40CM_2_61_4]|nr:MAG: hypothetical protein AUI33_17330 [Ignavibacteria bacterium 13_1_40CM_2_61_4]